MPYTQKDRLLSIKIIGLGDDDLLLAGFSGNEAISRLFSFSVEVLSQNGPVDFKKVLGKLATITVKQADGQPRYFNGFVIRFAQTGMDSDFTYYQLELAPYLWKFTRQSDCRIFHNKKVGEILETVFKDRGLVKHLHMSLTKTTYTPLEYCVQYRETDFNFVSRLMEQNGIFYFFQHTVDGHTMVVSDSNTDFKPCPGQTTASYNSSPSSGAQDTDIISAWAMERNMISDMYSLADYNFKTPSANMNATEITIQDTTTLNLEIFDYPGEFTTPTEGSAFTRLRMEAEEATHQVARGASFCRPFTTGYTFTLTDYTEADMNVEYVLTEIEHVATAGSYTTADGAGGDTYSNTFACIPNSVPFRPARLTPKPFVQGPQPAIVIGKNDDKDKDDGGGGDGEEIWVDKFGRVTVRFYWDRNKDSSCRVRVSQEWAGQGWGCITIPRVGQEVLVSFLEGDPDRPIVTGRVYNAERPVPFTLPDNQTQSGIKTRSTPKGTEENYNMIRFEDKKGSEDLLIHAEKTMHNTVESSQIISVGGDQTITVGGDRHITTGGIDKHGNKVGSVKELVFKNHNLHVKTDQVIKIEGKSHLHVMDAADSTYDKDFTQNITQKCILIADTIQLQATTKLVLMAGSSSLVIDASGVTVLGAPLINLNTPGAPPLTEIAPLAIDPEDP